MEFKLKGIVAKFYRWFYTNEDCYTQNNEVQSWVMPKDTCTYYKKLAYAILLVIPITLVSFPIMVHHAFTGKKESAKEKWSTSIMIYFSVGIVVLGLLLFSSPFLVYFGVYGPKTLIYGMFPVGTLLWVALILAGAYHGTMYVISRIKGTERVTIIGSYIKSVKEKYCEQIIWK